MGVKYIDDDSEVPSHAVPVEAAHSSGPISGIYIDSDQPITASEHHIQSAPVATQPTQDEVDSSQFNRPETTAALVAGAPLAAKMAPYVKKVMPDVYGAMNTHLPGLATMTKSGVTIPPQAPVEPIVPVEPAAPRTTQQSVEAWQTYNDAQNEAAKGVRRRSEFMKKFPNASPIPSTGPTPSEATQAKIALEEKIAAEAKAYREARAAAAAAEEAAKARPFIPGMPTVRAALNSPVAKFIASKAGPAAILGSLGYGGQQAYNDWREGHPVQAGLSAISGAAPAAAARFPAAAIPIGLAGLAAEGSRAFYKGAVENPYTKENPPSKFGRGSDAYFAEGGSVQGYATGGQVQHFDNGGQPDPTRLSPDLKDIKWFGDVGNPIENLKNNIAGAYDTITKVPGNIKSFVQDPVAYTKNLPAPTGDQIMNAMSPAHIGGAFMGTVGKMPRMSKADAIAEGYYHPVGGGKKLSVPFDQMTSTIIDNPNSVLAPRKSTTPEALFGGYGIPFVGDSAMAGKILTHVNKQKLAHDVDLEGGSNFMRGPDAWASQKNIITNLDNQAERAGRHGDPVYGVHTSMTPTGVDFNTMMTKGTFGMFDPKDIHPEVAARFDNAVRTKPEKNTKGEIIYPYTHFVGLQHPEVMDQLLQYGQGPLRKAVLNRMELKDFNDSGFPDIPAIRKAISEPDLINAPLGSTGHNISLLAPENRVITNPENPHGSYNTNFKGQYAGSLDELLPAQVMFKNFYDTRRALGRSPSSDTRAFTMSTPIQHFNQEWLDNAMQYLEARKQLVGKADGGLIALKEE